MIKHCSTQNEIKWIEDKIFSLILLINDIRKLEETIQEKDAWIKNLEFLLVFRNELIQKVNYRVQELEEIQKTKEKDVEDIYQEALASDKEFDEYIRNTDKKLNTLYEFIGQLITWNIK